MQFLNMIRLAAGASLLIGLGDYVLLKIGEPVGPFLFAFGLLGVCVLGLNLFTGKCGFMIEDKISPFKLIAILVVNLLVGYAIGVIFGLMDESVVAAAESKVAGWGVSWGFFLKAIMCGAIMYLAVELYRRGTKLGILFGVPLFIFCGFQHSIANVITMGVTMEYGQTAMLCVLICAAGNLVGAIMAWGCCRGDKGTVKAEAKRGNRQQTEGSDK